VKFEGVGGYYALGSPSPSENHLGHRRRADGSNSKFSRKGRGKGFVPDPWGGGRRKERVLTSEGVRGLKHWNVFT